MTRRSRPHHSMQLLENQLLRFQFYEYFLVLPSETTRWRLGGGAFCTLTLKQSYHGARRALLLRTSLDISEAASPFHRMCLVEVLLALFTKPPSSTRQKKEAMPVKKYFLAWMHVKFQASWP
mmetsp:Transcript_26247/g.52692  ORF Transcript_26247/g.52692 Transcript_26247/m.52692 type:complete len:122 (-) Transcript_26247:354-719(-)